MSGRLEGRYYRSSKECARQIKSPPSEWKRSGAEGEGGGRIFGGGGEGGSEGGVMLEFYQTPAFATSHWTVIARWRAFNERRQPTASTSGLINARSSSARTHSRPRFLILFKDYYFYIYKNIEFEIFIILIFLIYLIYDRSDRNGNTI